MKKTPLVKFDLDLYEEQLDNGLYVYVVPMPNVNNIYATFTTKFGSINTSFVSSKSNKMITVPDGIAHFLEHKMFEQKDGVDPFAFYSKRGADANANTNYFKTTYLFSGVSSFDENMNYLLDYVQDPYFTDENVEKEKGIIEQEMKMYQDNPYSVLYEGLVRNMFSKHPIKTPIIGNYKSIYSITKEDLYECYNAFYHPSNMFVVVTGNVNPEDVIQTIKDNQNTKTFKHLKEIKNKKYNEPKEVAKEKEVKLMNNITLPKVGIGYKLDISKIDLPIKTIYNYLGLLFDIKYDSTSLLNEQLKDEEIISDELYLNSLAVDKYYCIFVLAESKNPNILIKKVKEELNDTSISEKDFNRKKKALIASVIGSSDSVFNLNDKVTNNVARYNKVFTDDYTSIKKLNMDDYKKVVSAIDFSNVATYIINSK